MKKEAIGNYLIINGQVFSTEDKIFEKIRKAPIYEVIRGINGVALFLEDHLERMYRSAKLVNYQIGKDEKEIKEEIKLLMEKNNSGNINTKLLSVEIDGDKVFLVYNTESFYPPEDYYINGIHTTLFKHQRDNPNAKVQHSNFKENIAKALKEENAFEALLVNESGYIPEGSRSNMFFIKDNKVYTAKAEDVLLGVTRKHIFQVCEDLDIEIVEESINIKDLEVLDGAFMTGTSVNVLAISSIDKLKLNSVNNKIIKDISIAYNEKIKDYIEKNR